MADSVPGKFANIKNKRRNKDNSGSIFCDPCYEDGDEKTAEGFCVECQHYLCDQCYQVHCLPKPMRHHKLLGKSEMPKRKVDNSLSEICSQHKGEMIKYYCKTHETVGCNSCMITDHKPCQEICVLADIAKNVEQSTSYKEFCHRMDSLKEDLENQIQTAKENKAITKCWKETAISNISKLQEEINKQFESLKQQITREAEEKEANDIRKFQRVEDSANNSKDALYNLKEDFQILEGTNQSKQLFIAFNKSREKLKTLENEVEDIQRENKVEKYSFVSNEFLISMLKNIDVLGELCVQGEDDTEKDLKSFYGNYPEYGISKGTDISENMAVVIDAINNRVKLYTKSGYNTEKVLTSCPWDVAVIDIKKFAVTMPNEKKIKIMSVKKDSFKEKEEISLEDRCEGIDYAEEQLYVACSKPAKVLVLDMTGTIFQSISMDQEGKQIFKQPAYILFNNKKQLICVSDRKANCIVAMTPEGKVQNIFRNEKWKMPLTFIQNNDEIYTLDFEILHKSTIDLSTGECEIDQDLYENFIIPMDKME